MKGDDVMFWVNDPSTDTPISADNLSRMEKYTLATAGANGDFYVNFPNGANLATNDIVYILFPAATNGASNARLSVNNGTTYKNIKLSTVRLASEVQNRKLSFVYDGTDFVPLETEFFPITYVPTITPYTGALTTVTSTTSYIIKGKLLVWSGTFKIVNKGTGTGPLKITFPATPQVDCSFPLVFRTTGGTWGCLHSIGNSFGYLYAYDGTTPLENNYDFAFTAIIRIA